VGGAGRGRRDHRRLADLHGRRLGGVPGVRRGQRHVWAEPGWRDKLAAGFTNSTGLDGDKLNILISMVVLAVHFRRQRRGSQPARRVYSVRWRNPPSDLGPEVAPPAAGLRTAEHLGRRVARTALELASGRRSMATIMSAG
jgi:NAD(P)H dehydrogenase (quinone)